jgi:cobalt transporter subunit CbtA
MLSRRVLLCALLVGLGAGLITSAVQRCQIVPIIAAAEVFEAKLEPVSPAHDAASVASHAHEADAWEPRGGFERSAWTVVANVLTSIGFALLFVPAFGAWDSSRGDGGASLRSGVIWGVAGWVCVFLWPALGLPPALPGEAAAPLAARQGWWALSVASAAAGLSLLCLVRSRWRWLGLAIPALPFMICAPALAGARFAAFDAASAAQITELKSRFLIATTIASAVQWLALGMLSGAIVPRWLRPMLIVPSSAADSLSGSTRRSS